jgi:hypothetical protein
MSAIDVAGMDGDVPDQNQQCQAPTRWQSDAPRAKAEQEEEREDAVGK